MWVCFKLAGVVGAALICASACIPSAGEDFVHGYEVTLTSEQQWEMRENTAAQYPYERIDANGDGLVNLEEYAAYEWAMALATDWDGDGALTRFEYASLRVPPSPRDTFNIAEDRVNEEFSRLDDSPRDGRMTRAEFSVLAARFFRANDADCRDGFLDRFDLSMGGNASERRCPATPAGGVR